VNAGSVIPAIPGSLIHLPGAPSPALTQGAPGFSLSRLPPPFLLMQEGLTSFSPEGLSAQAAPKGA